MGLHLLGLLPKSKRKYVKQHYKKVKQCYKAEARRRIRQQSYICHQKVCDALVKNIQETSAGRSDKGEQYKVKVILPL